MNDLTIDFVRLLEPIEPMSCSEWCEQNIRLGLDPTSPGAYERFDLSLKPHLREPLDFWSRDHGGKLTVMAIEQTGKSTIWKLGLLYRLTNHPEPGLVIYPSEDAAIDENRDSLEPLMRGIPSLAELLEQPFARSRNCYRLGRGRIYFMGAGSPTISKRAAFVIGDEVDSWTIHEERTDNIKRMDHRVRSFPDPRRVVVCSPIGNGKLIYREFKQSSMGYWHLRCLHCGKLTIRSCDIAGSFNKEKEERVGGLQFDVVQNDSLEKRAVGSTIRLVCPQCGGEHVEGEAAQMNQEGGYVHRYPELLPLHAGYQFGALANIPHYFPQLSWLETANAQLKAGSSGTLADQMNFDNSFRGLPHRNRKHIHDGNADFEMQLRHHVAEMPKEKDIWFRLLTVDTQDDCFFYVIRGYLQNGDSYRLDYGRVETLEDVVRLLGKKVHGGFPLIGLQDVKGHREKELVPKLKRVHGMLMYRGMGAIRDGRRPVKWRRSSPSSKIFYVYARAYQSELLYKIHTQLDREKPFWYLPNDIGADYAKHILSMRPNERKRDGDQYENWEAVGDDDHWFDCEKMQIVLCEIATASMVKTGSRNLAPVKALAGQDPQPRQPPRRQQIKNY